jgi:hypothetical protein
MAVLGVWPWASFAQHYGKHDGLFDVIDGANLWVVPQVRETTPSCLSSWANITSAGLL